MKKNFAMRKVKSPQYSLEIKMRQGQHVDHQPKCNICLSESKKQIADRTLATERSS